MWIKMNNRSIKIFIGVLVSAIIAVILIINTKPSNDWLWISLLGIIFLFIVREIFSYSKKKKILHLIILLFYITIFCVVFFYFYYGKILIVN